MEDEILRAEIQSEVSDVKRLVPAAGVEPATFRSGGERSNPLSYAGKDWEKEDNITLRGLPDTRL